LLELGRMGNRTDKNGQTPRMSYIRQGEYVFFFKIAPPIILPSEATPSLPVVKPTTGCQVGKLRVPERKPLGPEIYSR